MYVPDASGTLRGAVGAVSVEQGSGLPATGLKVGVGEGVGVGDGVAVGGDGVGAGNGVAVGAGGGGGGGKVGKVGLGVGATVLFSSRRIGVSCKPSESEEASFSLCRALSNV